MSNVFLMCI